MSLSLMNGEGIKSVRLSPGEALTLDISGHQPAGRAVRIEVDHNGKWARLTMVTLKKKDGE